MTKTEAAPAPLPPQVALLARLGLFFVPEFLTEEERDRLRGEIDAATTAAAPVLRDGAPVLDASSRDAILAHVSATTTADLHRRFAGLIPRLCAHFGAALHECELPQCLVYEKGNFFGLHRDDGGAGALDFVRRRRISAVLFLDDAATATDHGSFRGGELVCCGLMPGWPETMGLPVPAIAGLLVAFDSGLTHGVQPVAEGRRRTVVTWYASAPEGAA